MKAEKEWTDVRAAHRVTSRGNPDRKSVQELDAARSRLRKRNRKDAREEDKSRGNEYEYDLVRLSDVEPRHKQ